jgi:hypothetical protein
MIIFSPLDYSKICQKSLEIDSQIRFAGVLDVDGCLVFGIHKDGVKSLLDDDEVKMSIHYTFQRWENLQNLQYKIGKEKTAVNEYDKVTLISIPFNNEELFLVSSEPKSDYSDILAKTKSIVKNFV